ncbi:MAG: hypothetical protein ACK44C_03060 [Polaromonas sp.]
MSNTSELSATTIGNQRVLTTTDMVNGQKATTYESVTQNFINGDIAVATTLAARTADVAIAAAKDITVKAKARTTLVWEKDANGNDKVGADGKKIKVMDTSTGQQMVEQGDLTNADINDINLLNKQASIAMAMNQSFTSLLSKIERTVATQ